MRVSLETINIDCCCSAAGRCRAGYDASRRSEQRQAAETSHRPHGSDDERESSLVHNSGLRQHPCGRDRERDQEVGERERDGEDAMRRMRPDE